MFSQHCSLVRFSLPSKQHTPPYFAMSCLNRKTIASFACLILLQLSISCSAGPVRSNSKASNIQQVVRNDAAYLKTKDADPVATTIEPLAPATEGLPPALEMDVSTKDQDEMVSDVLPEAIDEPAVSDVVDDAPILIEPVPEAEISLEVEDPLVDLKIVAEPLIEVAVDQEGPVVPAVVEHVEPVVDAPVSVTNVSPDVPFFIAALLPLEPVETPEAISEKVEIIPSEAPIYSPGYLPSPVLYHHSPIKSELSSYFPGRPFGSLPQPRELGFPGVSNTRENVLRDVNWHAKIGRAYRSSGFNYIKPFVF